jgi:hypothetical protein
MKSLIDLFQVTEERSATQRTTLRLKNLALPDENHSPALFFIGLQFSISCAASQGQKSVRKLIHYKLSFSHCQYRYHDRPALMEWAAKLKKGPVSWQSGALNGCSWPLLKHFQHIGI